MTLDLDRLEFLLRAARERDEWKRRLLDAEAHIRAVSVERDEAVRLLAEWHESAADDHIEGDCEACAFLARVDGKEGK